MYLILSIAINVGVLFFFKYLNFFTFSDIITFILPIGLSFHTFQAMSYTIEVYRGNFPAERNLMVYALYVMFYPQLVAGPIERPQHIIPQFKKKAILTYENFSSGIKYMIVGLYMKVMIADWLAPIVDVVYRTPHEFSAPLVVLVTFAFSIQIFCDFAGYSLIAIGSAKTLGISLMQNFSSPYIATSIKEFWRRWHISLSSWFRDYVYIPLGGNRNHAYRNILIVFGLSGLWHGASWAFVIWGLLHGLYIIIESRFKIQFGMIVTFILTTFAWIFFRAGTLDSSLSILRALSHNWSIHLVDIYALLDKALVPKIELLIVLLSIAVGIYMQKKNIHILNRGWVFYTTLTIIMIVFGKLLHSGGQFIYFQF